MTKTTVMMGTASREKKLRPLKLDQTVPTKMMFSPMPPRAKPSGVAKNGMYRAIISTTTITPMPDQPSITLMNMTETIRPPVLPRKYFISS